MSGTPPHHQSLNLTMVHRFRFAVCLMIGGITSVLFGQDANFDLKNYHLYNAFAFLHWRYDTDFFPPAIQAYFNPLADLPYYVLSMGPFATYPRGLAAFQGLYFGVLLYLGWRLNESLLEPISAMLATLIGITAVGVVSELGTTFNDIPIAALVIGALVLLAGEPKRGLPTLYAGAAFGAAVAIKFYAAYYELAAIFAMLLVYRRSAWRTVATLAFVSGLSFAVLHGWWAWWTWQMTGNPVFPYFNQVFHSPLFPPQPFSANFDGWTLRRLLIAPFRWAVLQQGMVTEIPFRDARALVGFTAAFALGILLVFRSPWDTSAQRRYVALILSFAAISYVFWLWQFRLLRFAIPLELLCGTLTLLAIHALCRIARVHCGWGPLAGTVTLVSLSAWTIYMNWGHVPYGGRVFHASSEKLPLPTNSLVLITEQPTAYVLPLIDAPGMRALGISYMSIISPDVASTISAQILAHEGPIFTIRTGANPPIANLGVTLSLRDCSRLTTSLDELQLCTVAAAPEPSHP